MGLSMKSEFYDYSFEEENINLKVYSGDGEEFIQYETELFENLVDPKGNVMPIFTTKPVQILPLAAYPPSERNKPVTNRLLFDGLVEITRKISYWMYPSRSSSHICNLGCAKSRETNNTNEIYLVLPSRESDILVTTYVDYRTIQCSDSLSEVRECLSLDEKLEHELMSRLEYDTSELLKPSEEGNDLLLSKTIKRLVDDIFDKNKSGVLPPQLDEIILFWENSRLVHNHQLEYPYHLYEVIIEGEYKYIQLDYSIIKK